MAIASTLRLVDPATGTELLNLTPWTATRLNSVDLGVPTYRTVSASISGAHGETDTTQYVGARAIAAVVTLPEGPAADAALDTVNSFMNPSKRFLMYVQRPGWATERFAVVRGSGAPCPPGVMRQAQISFVAPSGLLEDSTATTVDLVPTGVTAGGFTFPIVFPLTLTAGLIPGAALITVGGNIDTPPVIDIFGPCSSPFVRCVDTGEQIAFNISLAAGDFLRVDMGNRTAYLNADPNQSRYQTFDFTTSSWWSLPVGPSVQVVFSATSPTGGCQAQITYRSRYL